MALAALLAVPPVAADQLRVCADPNNLPFSNNRAEGFENKIADLVARALDMDLVYVWWAQRRGYIGEALNTGLCDVIAGIGRVEGVLLTYPPYYRSAYAFVTRAGEDAITSLDDPRLRQVEVGVQLVGDSDASTPPAASLARRGIVDNVRGYNVAGDYSAPNPPAAIINAVARGDIDVALAWGPLAGYFAAKATPPLVVTPIAAYADGPDLPMQFDISMGLRLDEGALRMRIEGALDEHRAEVDAILAEYHVPRIDVEAPL
jgi:mxaJ protein